MFMLKKVDPNWGLVALTVISMTAATFERCNTTNDALATRVTTVEAHEDDINHRLDRMENKLDTIFYYVTGVRPTHQDR